MKKMPKIKLNMIVVGDSGVGKTSLILRYLRNECSTRYDTTIGVDFITKEVKFQEQLITLSVFDTVFKRTYE